MEKITFKGLNFKYNLKKDMALNDINITISKGEFITLCGKSGSGKSTLLKHLKSSLSPKGDLSGEILIDGVNLVDIPERVQAKEIGFVSQSAENQLVADKVYHELAFTLESLSYSQEEIRNRVSETASFFGISEIISEDIFKLSGGQKQIVTLASVMILNPSFLILDEPTSQLDPIAAGEFFSVLKKINEELGTTIIISEHRLLDIIPLSSRVIVMENGKVIADGLPKDVGEKLYETKNEMFLSMPVPIRLYYGLGKDEKECPVTIKEGREWLKNKSFDNYIFRENKKTENNNITVSLKEVFFRYEKNGEDIIKNLSLDIYNKEIFAILGGNGTGKSTTLSLIAGVLKPYHGKIIYDSEIKESDVILLPQNCQSFFLKDTVYGELTNTLLSKYGHIDVNKINETLKIFDLEKYINTHPYDLSGGEQQRLGLAKIFLLNPKIILLDEPTKGIDVHFKKTLYEILNSLRETGVTIIIVSHDIEFCASYADRCAMFFNGSVSAVEDSREFFKTKLFYTTVANKLSKGIINNVVLIDDIFSACKKDEQKFYEKKEKPVFKVEPIETKKEIKIQTPKVKQKYNVLSILMVLIIIPLTVYYGLNFFGERKYYFISLLIALESLVLSIFKFENRKTKSGEIVVMAFMCAIAVISRVVFYMVPGVKPIIAIIIIGGLSLGKENGFMIGVFSALVSNMIFGQGFWTPYQMFAYGISGYIFGVLSEKNIIIKNRVLLSLSGAFVSFFVCGVLLDISSALTWQPNINVHQFIPYIVMGIPFNLILSISTFVFLYILSNPMLKKLERIKEKFDILT